ncbi:MAG: glucose-6-phosphate isomerase [Chaenotheca gracillima]|nr:MAG: glucose-6-phosphate isomerase [Chaenotheca gracillima]
MAQSPQFSTPPPKTQTTVLSFPTPHILLITLNRPKALNCISSAGHRELDQIYTWFDNEPTLRAGIITGAGRAFCAGADLKEWNNATSAGSSDKRQPMPRTGFGALSQRNGPAYKKPIIAAVNGLCFGGGFEMAINADLIVADAQNAQFGLPEVKRGVVAIAGALPRLVRTIGRQRAMEMALTGRTVSASEMREWGVVNRVVAGASSGDGSAEAVLQRPVVQEAIALAELIAANSPDAVIISKQGIENGWTGLGVREGSEKLQQDWGDKLAAGDNYREGLMAFAEKRPVKWVPSKL